MNDNSDYDDEIPKTDTVKEEGQKELINVFLKELDDEIPVYIQEKIDPRITTLLNCYNRYAVKDGYLIAVDDKDTNLILKERLARLPLEELKTMLFKYNDTVNRAKLLTKEEVKERFKYRLITAGFIFICILSIIVAAIFIIIHRENPESADPSIYREIFTTIVEVLRIITNL